MGLNINARMKGAGRRGIMPKLSFTTTETNTFTGEVRMTTGPMEVDWGDGTVEEIADGADNLTHDYGGASGDKEIVITFLKGYGDVTEFHANSTNSKGDISDWPVDKFKNLKIFKIYLNDFTGDLSGWDISGLTNLSVFRIYQNSFTGLPDIASATDWSGGEWDLQSNTDIPASEVSAFIVDLDDYDGTGGDLEVQGCNDGSMTYSDLTSAAQTAHDNLVDNKSWTITMDS